MKSLNCKLQIQWSNRIRTQYNVKKNRNNNNIKNKQTKEAQTQSLYLPYTHFVFAH